MTRGTWSERHQRLVFDTKPTGGEFENLPFPGSRVAADLPTPELMRAIVAAGAPGASASMGRQDLLRAYASLLGRIRSEAGDRAVRDWLNSLEA